MVSRVTLLSLLSLILMHSSYGGHGTVSDPVHMLHSGRKSLVLGECYFWSDIPAIAVAGHLNVLSGCFWIVCDTIRGSHSHGPTAAPPLLWGRSNCWMLCRMDTGWMQDSMLMDLVLCKSPGSGGSWGPSGRKSKPLAGISFYFCENKVLALPGSKTPI